MSDVFLNCSPLYYILEFLTFFKKRFIHSFYVYDCFLTEEEIIYPGAGVKDACGC